MKKARQLLLPGYYQAQAFLINRPVHFSPFFIFEGNAKSG
jgi:hypothetical protein